MTVEVFFFTTEACGQASTEGTEFHRDGLWHVSVDCRESLQAYKAENVYGGHRPPFGRQAPSLSWGLIATKRAPIYVLCVKSTCPMWFKT